MADFIDEEGYRANVGIILTNGSARVFWAGRAGRDGWQFPTRGWLRYRLPRRYVRRHSSPLCVGQKQRWFMLRLLSAESRVRFDTTSHPEFDRWRWVDYWHPVREVIYFKRRVYRKALEELGQLAFPDGPPPCPAPRRRSKSAD
jgi:putative (di)nucleoside polyphosphate hydrolase